MKESTIRKHYKTHQKVCKDWSVSYWSFRQRIFHKWLITKAINTPNSVYIRKNNHQNEPEAAGYCESEAPRKKEYTFLITKYAALVIISIIAVIFVLLIIWIVSIVI